MRVRQFKKGGRALRTTPGFPTVEVHKGDPKDDKGRVGSDRPDFRLEWPEGYEDVQAVFEARWGKYPKVFENIRLMSDNLEEAFGSAMEKWTTGQSGKPQLQRRCDGVVIMFLRPEQGKAQRNTGESCLDECDCVQVGRLTWVVPELIALTGQFLLFKLVTHAKSDIENILATLDFAELGSQGFLRGVAFKLWREPVSVVTPDGITVTKHQVKFGIAQASAPQIAAGYAGNVLQLVAGVTQPDSADEYLAIPENTTSATKKTTSAKTVKLQPLVALFVGKNGQMIYAFKPSKGSTRFYCYDQSVVLAAIPGLMSLEPERTHPLDVRGFEATYADTEVEGEAVITSLKAL